MWGLSGSTFQYTLKVDDRLNIPPRGIAVTRSERAFALLAVAPKRIVQISQRVIKVIVYNSYFGPPLDALQPQLCIGSIRRHLNPRIPQLFGPISESYRHCHHNLAIAPGVTTSRDTTRLRILQLGRSRTISNFRALRRLYKSQATELCQQTLASTQPPLPRHRSASLGFREVSWCSFRTLKQLSSPAWVCWWLGGPQRWRRQVLPPRSSARVLVVLWACNHGLTLSVPSVEAVTLPRQ